MDRWQAQDTFWNSFSWNAYDENTVPSDANLPYITYEAVTGSIGGTMSVSVSLWDRSNSWAVISKKADDIEKGINRQIKIDGGYMKVRKPASGFARRMDEPSDSTIRRIVLSVGSIILTSFKSAVAASYAILTGCLSGKFHTGNVSNLAYPALTPL